MTISKEDGRWAKKGGAQKRRKKEEKKTKKKKEGKEQSSDSIQTHAPEKKEIERRIKRGRARERRTGEKGRSGVEGKNKKTTSQ